jgi:hypothetical protein
MQRQVPISFTYRSSAITSSAQEQVISRQISKFWPSATLLPFDINCAARRELVARGGARKLDAGAHEGC